MVTAGGAIDMDPGRLRGRSSGMKLTIYEHLQRKLAELRHWLDEHAPHADREQRHLEEGTNERAYWHYGYFVAVRDICALIDLDEKRQR